MEGQNKKQETKCLQQLSNASALLIDLHCLSQTFTITCVRTISTLLAHLHGKTALDTNYQMINGNTHLSMPNSQFYENTLKQYISKRSLEYHTRISRCKTLLIENVNAIPIESIDHIQTSKSKALHCIQRSSYDKLFSTITTIHVSVV